MVTQESNGKTLRQLIAERYSALKSERAPWVTHWTDISRFILPRGAKFQTTDRNRGGDQARHIYDNTGCRALQVMASGLMAGATSPARPWFRLAAPDPDLNKFHSVKRWTADVVERMQMVFSSSNVYRALPQVYKQLAAYGTGPMTVAHDFENIIHCHPHAAGEYCLATDFRGVPNTFFREFDITVAQAVREFGLERCSQSVRDQWTRGNLNAAVTIVHAVEPRDDRDPESSDAANMPWRSVYFEWGLAGRNREQDGVLRESGHRRFPVLAPRWDPEPGDAYGGSQAMMALFDVKALQQLTLRHGQAVDFMTDPPKSLPAAMRGKESNFYPGGKSFVDQGAKIEPVYQPNLDLSHLEFNMAQVRARIEAAFFNDLFLMIATSSDTTQRTAAEIAERHEEKLLMLGPALENLHNELLSPLVDITFERMMEVGALPPPPRELEGIELRVEFISMLAQAQRAININGIDRWTANLGGVAQFRPEVIDKFDADEWAEYTADILNVPPRLIVPAERVAQIREARAAAEKAKEQAAMMQQHAAAARDLGAATDKPNALTTGDAVGMFSGVSTEGLV